MRAEMSHHWGPGNATNPLHIGNQGQATRDRITQALLRASEKDCNDSRNRFIPRAALIEIINLEEVGEILKAREDADHWQNVAQDICPAHQGCACGWRYCTGRRMIFATLLLCRREELMLSRFYLRNPQLCDKDLPLNSDFFNNTDLNVSAKERELFIYTQWQVYTPFLTEFGTGNNQAVGELPMEVSLPWREKARIGKPILGEVSYVERIEIYPDSHDLTQDSDQVFALKTFEQRLAAGLSEEKFQQEVQANHKAPRHNRIVRLLSAFAYRDRYYLLFPFANEGSLENLWKSYTPDGVIRQITPVRVADWYSDEWLLSECLGIAEALVATHNLADGHLERTNALLHADIKPENILCFRDSGSNQLGIPVVLKLADFGEARRFEPNKALKASQVAHVKTYRPPEHCPGSLITLKYDVWCLGCLFLDFVTWAILGQDGIDSFRRKREVEEDDPAVTEAPGQLIEDTFFKTVKQEPTPLLFNRLHWGRNRKLKVDSRRATTRYSLWASSHVNVGTRVRDAVVSHLRVLRQHHRCSDRLEQVLLFVGGKMLVVDPGKRAGSLEVQEFLSGLIDRR
ncbi:hypothetical protein N8I77_003071 [Diaporthe amygdali]|uniref:Protein kinase domain-containing protein n=1 Tax=Phomopsis amygdali TaxID=1214568 RepID=A0AAD9SJ74_PHOAM|nr:hypothetical protein N8I77_003071 [Diaporthe amygdali]